MLALTISMDDYREDLFKEYTDFPLAEAHQFGTQGDLLKERSHQSQNHCQHWQKCLKNVQYSSGAKDRQGKVFDGIVEKYLYELCILKNGSLKDFAKSLPSAYLDKIEKRVQVYLSEKGMLDIPRNYLTPEEFKEIQEEVHIKFALSDQRQFRVEDPVKLRVQIKNISELQIKIFEINTETYYRQHKAKLDSNIDLNGMVPYI
jgi:hypothetical protein